MKILQQKVKILLLKNEDSSAENEEILLLTSADGLCLQRGRGTGGYGYPCISGSILG